MDNTALTCRNEQRRVTARQRDFNGIDYVSIGADQTTLCVHLFGEYPSGIEPANVRIEGGRRVRDIKVLSVKPEQEEDPELGECMHIELDKAGDFSTYKLCLVEVDQEKQQASGYPARKLFEKFDPRYSCIEFSFKVDCPSDLDCQDDQSCPPEEERAPEINYLAKDYAGFRQLILDRLALLMPDWRERHVPDIGITLVELLAYVGDHLSYYQDAVATEAYLDTARQRISVRRHARLVDYQMHEGCNARAFVFVETSGDLTLDPQRIYFITRCAELERAGKRAIDADEFDQLGIPSSRYEVFMPMIAPNSSDIRLYQAHSAIPFYTWGDAECCLPRGATRATLKDEFQTRSEDEPTSEPDYEPKYKPTYEPKYKPTYESQQPTYEPQQPTYEPQQPTYEPQQPTYEPQQPTYEPQQPTYEPQQPTYEPQQQPTYLPKYEPTREPKYELKYEPKPKPAYETPAYSHAYLSAKDGQQQEELRKLNLVVGDVLIFEELIGPKTGDPADADPAHRHAVRLTKVEPAVDPLFNQPLVEIEWAEEDALPFALCISAVLPAPECQLVEGISVARGNIVVVDHGRAIDPPEPLGQVPLQTTVGECECGAAEMSHVAGKFRPVLKSAPLTFSEPLNTRLPAAAALTQDPRRALPQITRLTGLPDVCSGPDEPGREAARARLLDGVSPNDSIWQWSPQRDLLSSESTDRHFVAEMDNDGHAHLRFGDGELGRKPDACMSFAATYRVGNGNSGNVGADTINHLVFRGNVSGASLQPRNPLAARGGIEPEPVSEVKLYASGAFRKDLRRAVIADDYARLAERNRKLQRAAGELRWTGSWYEARVAIDPHDTTEIAGPMLSEIAGDLHSYRRVGHDLSIVPADYVPLEIELTICVLAHYQRGHVEAALRDAFSNRVLPGGKLGFFQPDQLTFGSGIYLSRLIGAAQAVPGVESVTVKLLKRRFLDEDGEIESGVLPLGVSEIAQLENDLSFPEHGKLTLNMIGGR